MIIIDHADQKLVNKTSSKGNQGKYNINNQWYKIDHMGYEGAAEFLCSALLKHSNIENFVDYSLNKFKIVKNEDITFVKNGCVSKSFLPQNCELISLDSLLKQAGAPFSKIIQGLPITEAISKVVTIVEKETGIKNFGEYLTAMFEFDALVLNEDRHTQNIMFILNDNGEYSLAPIFDNGASFLSDTFQEYPIENNPKKMIGHVKSKPFSSSFKAQVEACHELYGSQLEIEKIDITPYLFQISQNYGEAISKRIGHIYDLQTIKCKDLITIKEQLQIPGFRPEEIVDYKESGGKLICSFVKKNLSTVLSNALTDEEISFTLIKPEDSEGVLFVFKDMDQREVLQIERKIFGFQEIPQNNELSKEISVNFDFEKE